MIAIAIVLAACFPVAAQTSLSAPPRVDQLLADQKWEEVVGLLASLPARTSEQDFAYAAALAHLDRLPEATAALQAGMRLAPDDPRFPTELAGIEFKHKHYPQTAHLLRRAVRLSPHDPYVNNFLGTVYFVDGNLQAALKYWNRIDKPRITQEETDPVPRVEPSLLDRAFTFAPATTLQLAQLLDTEERVRGLGIFSQFHFDLNARSDRAFDVLFRNQEKNGFGETRLEALALTLRELPFQGVTPEYDNLRRKAINFGSLVRWDAQKRRLWVEFTGPFERSAKYRWGLAADLRDENWTIVNGFTGPEPVLASLNLRSGVAGFDLASYARDRFRWAAGAELSHRNFRNVASGTVLTQPLLATGYALTQSVAIGGTLFRVPEHRFSMDAGAVSRAQRLWSTQGAASERMEGSLGWHWFPQFTSDDYETQQRVRAGKTFGQVPFDQLFMLALERDNNLLMRAHIGSRDGRKGSAPLGRDYFLQNWEADKNLYSNGLMALKVGPFVDVGAISDPGTALGSHRWLFDTGAQVKFRVFSAQVAFSYGKDLRSGNNAFYVRLLPTADSPAR